MVVELLVICVTVFLLLAPWAYAKAAHEREKAHRLEIENDKLED